MNGVSGFPRLALAVHDFYETLSTALIVYPSIAFRLNGRSCPVCRGVPEPTHGSADWWMET